MAIPTLTDEERHFVRLSLLECPAKQVAAANQVAALLAEDEEDMQNAFLVYTVYYSQPENTRKAFCMSSSSSARRAAT